MNSSSSLTNMKKPKTVAMHNRMVARDRQTDRQTEVEVKVERRSDFLYLSLSLNLNLLRAGGFFPHPFVVNT